MIATILTTAAALTALAAAALIRRHRRLLAAHQAWADTTIPWLRSMRSDLRDTQEMERVRAAGMQRTANAAARGDRRAEIRWRRWLVHSARWARSAGWGPRLP